MELYQEGFRIPPVKLGLESSKNGYDKYFLPTMIRMAAMTAAMIYFTEIIIISNPHLPYSAAHKKIKLNVYFFVDLVFWSFYVHF
ncbi:MAG: hypothetical protein ACE5I5_01315 [Candidatus Heimdallarchaeota archaeon]